ncbi:MAG: GTP-binding protein [Anaeromicrobium sp.]|jgi:bifunctional enzyme CysN/CysC|uniref:GTP-binding protein n=1 Tax=Anaeromicrobium sp. TaxID=1929132 RepID=UPI0025E24F24|nr:GTP-binding protein [Anaeromicrobium sp.]MCT4595277.1 GTP-binding protein [Anaeromicrobium sp.]
MAICKEDMNIVIVGHVDHGKSTIIGRLLADTNSLPKGKLEQVKEICRRNSKPFEYAFLLDALKDEQAQGITIDTARCFFKTKKRNYIIIDAPGHLEFLKNMVTGASRAEAALLVVDAKEGVKENSRRHAYMLSMLGVKQISVLVNKMDLVNYDMKIYKNIVNELKDFFKKLDIEVKSFIPVSGMMGDNIAINSTNMNWHKGETVLETLDSFKAEEKPINKPFRMPIQDVYKFTKNNDNRRILAGRILAGQLSIGDEVVFYPSGKKSKVKKIESFNKENQKTVSTGYSVGFTLEEQIFIKRGEIATLYKELNPKVTTRIKVNLFWLGKEPMEMGKKYSLKLGTAKVGVKIEQLNKIIDASNLESIRKDKIEKHDVAECVLKLDKAVAFDLAHEIVETSRFVIVDNYSIAGGGIILKGLEDKENWVREKVLIRNYKWEKSMITQEERSEKYNQRPTLILITGEKNIGKKTIAKALEKILFNDGKIVYFLGIGNVLYGVDADIKTSTNNRKDESLRRLAEVANIMIDAGVILILTAVELSQNNLDIIKTTINSERIETIWVGENVTTNISYDLRISSSDPLEKAVREIKTLLQNKGIIFKP